MSEILKLALLFVVQLNVQQFTGMMMLLNNMFIALLQLLLF